MSAGVGGFSSGATEEIGSIMLLLETVFSGVALTGILENYMPAGIVRMSLPF